MCDEHEHDHASALTLTRRGVLQGLVAVAAFAGLSSSRAPVSAVPLGSRAPSVDGLNSYVLGMHLHASTSEGVGSVRSQLAQAALNNFDVAWFTEHDWRRNRLLFRPTYRFLDSDLMYGGGWTVGKLADSGSLTPGSGGALGTGTVSPKDPGGGSLRLRATSSGDSVGRVRYRVNSEGKSRANFRSRIAGRTLSVEVLPTRSGTDAWAEVELRLSHHPATGGRPAGIYSLLYRLRTGTTKRKVGAQGINGIVDVPVRPNTWNTLTLNPAEDAAAAWPDVEAADNSLNEIEFHAASRGGAPAEVFFSYLRLDELAGYDALGVEHQLLHTYGVDVERTAGLLGLVGTEISLGPHINQYGGAQTPYDYGNPGSLTEGYTGVQPSVVSWIHRQGGLASLNHPFKPGDIGELTSARAVARNLLEIGGGGADILEVGYAKKQGGTLVDLLAVWDTLSRNGLFLTANGVSDDHTGQDWASQANRFYTVAWATRKTEAALLAALAAGRGYVGFLGGFGGTVDMDLDGEVRMGQVAVNSAAGRDLNVRVTGLPDGGAVQLVRGVVDPRGTADPTPNTTVRTLKADTTSVPLDTGEDCFHRLQVVDGSGVVVAFGQPIWTFRGTASTPIPAARRTTA